ncbi:MULTISPECIES: hypothetical protein [Subtercola]|uniref:Uncharacterized protein n=1 Tax=Subtercola vilae TaxID=2056433 RepID=A0A4T2C6P3_9MICO|nr:MULTISPECIES: hypothetical protein [Subtercola]MEA9984803.1 hypothetical protein [Subtercola sp. RTI3]TIH38971.1 hypothetical protein D4765_05205 [Subtercola vilae]
MSQLTPPENRAEALRLLALLDAERADSAGSSVARYGALAEALTGAYAGRQDPIDALWWRAHPLQSTPAGHADPASVRAQLEAAAFSRRPEGEAALAIDVIDPVSGEHTSVSAPFAALVALDEQLRADAAALDAAILDARPAITAAESRAAHRAAGSSADLGPNDPAGAPAPESPFGAEAAAGHPETGSDSTGNATRTSTRNTTQARTPTPTRTAESWRRRSLIWMSTAAAVTVLLLAGIALVVVQQLNPSGTGFALFPGSGSTTSAGSGIGASPSATPGDFAGRAGSSLGLTIFEDPTLAPSIPPAGIDPYYKPESLRLLGVADSDLTVYAVENRLEQPCLLAVYTDGTQSATCVTRDEFNAMGIELRITNLRVTRASEPQPTSASQDVVFWNPDGTYGVSSTLARTGSTAGIRSSATPTPTPTAGTPTVTPTPTPTPSE